MIGETCLPFARIISGGFTPAIPRAPLFRNVKPMRQRGDVAPRASLTVRVGVAKRPFSHS
jgi:hypothetical protein